MTRTRTTPFEDRKIRQAKIDVLESLKMLMIAELKKKLNAGSHNTSATVREMQGAIDSLQESIDCMEGEKNEHASTD